ncbi:uncharacterized protein LOC119741365 [Patiria miniata]|uniref:Reverse transcriptase n=1 Tax=Patiria miniata TaxID=46514 RepID=A0A914BB28_PATMI|nr:uncharacterized protein LOC119741365 [Patiria miniata]
MTAQPTTEVSPFNTQLLQGPDLTNSLIGVLTRFRQDQVALMSDIEGMFSQVLVPRDDRDLLRLLWWDNGDIKKPLTEYRMKVHVFGAVSSPSCANYALKKTADDHAESEEIAHIIHRNFYVDDCLCSTPLVSKAVQLVKGLTKTCSKGGFHLTKLVSNKKEVLEIIPKDERGRNWKDLNIDGEKLAVERALGIMWSIEDDEFGYKIEMRDRPPTRGGILSTSALSSTPWDVSQQLCFQPSNYCKPHVG